MNKVILLNVDLSHNDYSTNLITFSTKTFDTILLEINLVSRATPSEVVVYGKRSDGESLVQTTDIQIVENKIYVKLSNSFTCLEGVQELELRLIGNEGQVSTKTYKYLVNKNLSSTDSFEVVTVHQLKGINEEAKANITNLTNVNTIAESNRDNLEEAIVEATGLTKGLTSENKSAIINLGKLEENNTSASSNIPVLRELNSIATTINPKLEENNVLANSLLPSLREENDQAQLLLPTLIDEISKATQLLESLKLFIQNNNVDNILEELQNLKTNQNILVPPTNTSMRIRLSVDDQGILTTEILD